MVAHHHCVFEKKKIGGPTELFYFGEGPRRSCLGPNRDQLRKLKIILRDVLIVLGLKAALLSIKCQTAAIDLPIRIDLLFGPL
jgi:hypothetical protein